MSLFVEGETREGRGKGTIDVFLGACLEKIMERERKIKTEK